MDNFNIKIDLLKIHGAFLTNIKGKTATKKCICIDIDDRLNTLFLGEKGCYLNLSANATKNNTYGDTHFVKPSFDKKDYDNFIEEEKKEILICGNMKPFPNKQMEVEQTIEPQDDLPF